MKKYSVNTENLTYRQKNSTEKYNVLESDAILIEKYSDLVNEVAELSFLNKNYMLFFRGQDKDHKKINSEKTSLYPSIYRGRVNDKEKDLNYKVSLLNRAAGILKEEVRSSNIIGKDEIINKKYVQWSILQHYGICETPLLDITHSLRVACSFATINNDNKYGYIYVLALPYVTHRISTNSELETVIVRLLSISPPQALRPYHQDGYLVGTEFITEDIDDKQELDLINRLIAKYKIKNDLSFWNQDVQGIPQEILYPDNQDIFIDIANKVKVQLDSYRNIERDDDFNREFGKFMVNWNNLQSISKNINIKSSMNNLFNNQTLDKNQYQSFKNLLNFRNNLVHNPNLISIDDLRKFNAILNNLLFNLDTIGH
jgi:hypothetical protein